MTDQERKFRTSRIGENHVARMLRGKLLSHHDAFDVETDSLLIEVKTISHRQMIRSPRRNNPVIHINGFSKEAKDETAIQKGKIALLIACVLYRNKVVEMRFGIVKRWVRWNSLYPIAELSEILNFK